MCGEISSSPGASISVSRLQPELLNLQRSLQTPTVPLCITAETTVQLQILRETLQLPWGTEDAHPHSHSSLQGTYQRSQMIWECQLNLVAFAVSIVWKGLLSSVASARSPAYPYWRKAIQLWPLYEVVCRSLQPKSPSTDPFGDQKVSMQDVPEDIFSHVSSQQTRE